MTAGLYLLSHLEPEKGFWKSALCMAVLGLRIGLGMQVLTIAGQNTVGYRDLGVATSGVTFLRSIGSSFGAAIFGMVYANQLGPNLAGALAAHTCLRESIHVRRSCRRRCTSFRRPCHSV